MPDMDEIWANDCLGRKEEAEYLATFLRKRSEELADRGDNRSYVLNLDARWGEGKTFFLTRFRDELRASGHVACYVDAWADDFAEDPLLAVMAAIEDELRQFKGRPTAATAAF